MLSEGHAISRFKYTTIQRDFLNVQMNEDKAVKVVCLHVYWKCGILYVAHRIVHGVNYYRHKSSRRSENALQTMRYVRIDLLTAVLV